MHGAVPEGLRAGGVIETEAERLIPSALSSRRRSLGFRVAMAKEGQGEGGASGERRAGRISGHAQTWISLPREGDPDQHSGLARGAHAPDGVVERPGHAGRAPHRREVAIALHRFLPRREAAPTRTVRGRLHAKKAIAATLTEIWWWPTRRIHARGPASIGCSRFETRRELRPAARVGRPYAAAAGGLTPSAQDAPGSRFEFGDAARAPGRAGDL